MADPNNPYDQQIPDITPDWREKAARVFGAASGENNGLLSMALDQHHQQRLAQAKMHHDSAVTAGGALYQIKSGIDPETGQHFDDPAYKGRGQAALQSEYQTRYDTSMDAYEKVAGVNKDAKGAIQKARDIVGHIIHTGSQQNMQNRPPGLPPPPQVAQPSDYPTTVMEGGVSQTPPPSPYPTNVSESGVTFTPPPSMSSMANAPSTTPAPPIDARKQLRDQEIQAPFLRQQMMQRQALKDYTDRERALYQLKIEEDQAKAKAKAAAGGNTGNPPRPVFSRPVSVLDARKLGQGGQVFEDKNGDPVDLDSIPDSMSLQPFTTRVTETDADGNSKQVWKVRYIPMSPNQKTVTVGNETYAVNPADVSKPGVPTPLGPHNVPTTTTTEKPGFTAEGKPTTFTLRSTHTPGTPGMAAAPTAGVGTAGRVPAAPKTGGVPAAQKGNTLTNKAGEMVFPAPQYMQAAKPATGIDQARSSLVGDNIDKGQVAGLASDLKIFKDPEAVKRVGVYLQLVDNVMANAGDKIAQQGPVAGIEWWAGLPQAIIGLQQGALKESYDKLNADDKKFVADYFRTMGTQGGMRASTGMPGYEWAFHNMYKEMPTPGQIDNYDDSITRLMNYVNETNVAAKRNALVGKVDTEDIEKKIRGGGGGRKSAISAAPTPGGPPKTADEYLSNLGIKPKKQ